MYYIIETKYVGPNQDTGQYTDVDKVDITDTPAITNSSHEERIEGWCGTTNDWAVYAHGEYETLDAARNAVTEQFGETRLIEPNGTVDEYDREDEGVVERYKPGKFEPLSLEASEYWIFEGMKQSVTAATTDAEIKSLAAEFEQTANDEIGCTLDPDITATIQVYRDDLRAERDDDDE